MVQDRGGAEFKTAGIHQYFEDFKRGTNPAKGGRPKVNFEIASSHRCRSYARICVLALVAILLGAGCASKNYGSLKHSQEVAQAFETYHVFKDHRYYYLNQENKPYAVVAVKNSYRIDSVMWREFDPQGGKLEKIVDLVKEFSGVSSFTYGSYILDAQSNQVGYWYSKLRMTGVKVDNETRLVSIRTPTPWLRDDDRVYGPGVGIGIGSGGSGIGIRF